MTSISSSVNLPQRSLTDPFSCFHLPFIWSEFIFYAPCLLHLSSGQSHVPPLYPEDSGIFPRRANDGLTCSAQIPINFRIVRARLTSRRDILGTGRLQNLLGPLLPLGVLAMNRDQDPTIFDPAFVTLSFVFRDAHSHQRSGNAADRA